MLCQAPNTTIAPHTGEIMRNIAVAAGAAIMPFHRKRGLQTEQKADGTPVSEADLAANTIILAGLRQAFPQIPIVTEETGGDTPTDWAAPFFLIDPLDGTKEFINGSDQFTVNIALIIHHQPVLGVVYAPALPRLQWVRQPGEAVEEVPPFAPNCIGNVAPITCRTANNAALTAVLSRSHLTPLTHAYADQYAIAESSQAGSSLKFCLLANGEADFYPRLSPTMEWDTAAADAVLRAAGGRTVDYQTGHDLVYGKPNLENPFFIAVGRNVVIHPPLPS